MRGKRSKKKLVTREVIPRQAEMLCSKKKEAWNCISKPRRQLIYRAAHRRGC